MPGDEEKDKAPETPEEQEKNEGDEGEAKGEEEDTGAHIAPIVKLEEVSVSTGEENEEVLFEIKSKLYRFDKDGSQWKERGVGQVKLLEHKETKKIRLLMRQQKTLKICANHQVDPETQLQEHAGSDKSLVWATSDFADGELKKELFTMRFGSIESLQRFRTAFQEAQEKMKVVLGAAPEGTNQEGGGEAPKEEDAGEEGKAEEVIEKKDEAVDAAAKALEDLKIPAEEGKEASKET